MIRAEQVRAAAEVIARKSYAGRGGWEAVSPQVRDIFISRAEEVAREALEAAERA